MSSFWKCKCFVKVIDNARVLLNKMTKRIIIWNKKKLSFNFLWFNIVLHEVTDICDSLFLLD